jgi:sec-independent protein translocase protein TatA
MDVGWPEIAIIAVVILVLFGSKKMPDAARSLGRSMRILKSEVKGLHDDDAADKAAAAPPAALPPAAAAVPPATPPTTAAPTTAAPDHVTAGEHVQAP